MQQPNQFPCQYGVKFKDALSFGSTIGLGRTPLVDDRPIQPVMLEKANDLIHEMAYQWRCGLPDYHGDQCMEVSSRLYGLLNSHDIAADIVIGSVTVLSSTLYDITPELIAQEVKNPGDENSGLNLHAWLTIGGDTIIDYTLPSMLTVKMGAPPHFLKAGFVENAAELFSRSIVYEPMLVGAEFMGRINTYDPHDILEKLKV